MLPSPRPPRGLTGEGRPEGHESLLTLCDLT
jgi:hypothetical protein